MLFLELISEFTTCVNSGEGHYDSHHWLLGSRARARARVCIRVLRAYGVSVRVLNTKCCVSQVAKPSDTLQNRVSSSGMVHVCAERASRVCAGWAARGTPRSSAKRVACQATRSLALLLHVTADYTRTAPTACQAQAPAGPEVQGLLTYLHRHTQLSSTTHGTTDRSREGRERKEVHGKSRLGRCAGPTRRVRRGQGVAPHRDRAVGFVDSVGEATSRSQADGLA